MSAETLDAVGLRELLLVRFPFLSALSDELLTALADPATVVSVPAGTVLFDETAPCRALPLVLDGAVRVVKVAASGREIRLYRIISGESCVMSGGCLLTRQPYSARAVTESDARLLVIPAPLFERLLAEGGTFREFVFGMFHERLSELMALVEDVAFSRLDRRLASLLLGHGRELRTTHQKLADELGSVREIVSRLLRMFEDRGWVSLERERIVILDPQALREMGEGRG